MLIDKLYDAVKDFEITELRERRNLEVSFENLRNSPYGADREGEYPLYYIMK